MDITCGSVSSFVDKFWDLVLDPTCEQFHHLFHYHKNIKQLNERLVELIDERSSIKHQIDEATNNAEPIEDKVLHWLRKVDEISEQIQKFHEEESQAKTECSVISCPNPWLRYKLSKRAKAMAQEVVEICGKGNFNTVSYRVPPPSMPELFNRESNAGIGSRVHIVNQIIEELRNPSVNMIGLCGLGGVGKTTIAKEVAKSQNMFEKVILAIVSQELNVEKIQGQIAVKLGMQLNETFEEVRACRLCKRLKQEKNMLLILDDLWEGLDLGKVGIPFFDVENYNKKNEGCKILLTSRNETLLSNRMKCQKTIRVGFLSEDEAWELFKRIAELSVDSSSPDLISIANAIVQKCKGLPLAIATAAKELLGKNLDDWKDYLARLNNPLRRNITGIREVDTILISSYDRLSSSENKHIFLLGAMLSHDPSIEVLLMHSMGLDFLKHAENMEEAHNGISAIVSKLKSSNLFLDSFSNHRFTIHDIFRDIALSIASDELHAFIVRHRKLTEWPDKNMQEGYKGICLRRSEISDLPEELYCPKLEFFLLDSTERDLTIPNMFFKSSKELKLLAFSNVHFLSLPSLSFLIKLKTLCLHSCLLEDISEVRSLKNLKVLSFAYSEIELLPIQLAELTSLQMLNLAHCSKLKVIPPKLLSSLKKLEVLHMGNSFNQWKIEGSSEANENASLDELKDLPISSLDIHIPNVSMLPETLFLDLNLKRYRIFIGGLWKWQGNHETSKMLKLDLEGSIHLKPGVRKLITGAEDLYLYGSNGLENVLHGHGGRAFPHLRHLHIESNDTIRYIVLNSAHLEAATNNISGKMSELLFNNVLLPKLERLELSNSINLIPMIRDGQLSHTSFSNLKTLIVKNCGFVKLVPLCVLKSLYNLEELEVKNCDMLEMVLDFEDLNEYKETVSSSIQVVSLKKLELYGLPKLKNVWSNHYQGNVSFPSLKSIHVSSCESLTSLFPPSIAKGMLRDLEELLICNCGIDVIVAKDQVSKSVASTFEFPRLTSLKLSSLQNLKNFYPRRHTLEWPQLRRLCITYCDELEIFEKEVSSSLEIHEEESTLDSKYPLLSHDKDIRNLEELRLRGKGAKMIGSGHFPMNYHFPKVKLLHLSVEKAPTISYKSLLKSFPKLEELELGGDIKEAFGGDEVPFPIKLTLQNLYEMKSVASSLVSLPNLTSYGEIFLWVDHFDDVINCSNLGPSNTSLN
ncbi:probable disease resistance protein At4g27220 [Neltuma alba]|uniref:probable disease resistance protein At4g27220 n=1 Tax=Neltuma alba TaxID=207710 RepID=UPI0010A368CB|nr:probable disease resistance protein At4g27220 [Prosopis alba]